MTMPAVDVAVMMVMVVTAPAPVSTPVPAATSTPVGESQLRQTEHDTQREQRQQATREVKQTHGGQLLPGGRAGPLKHSARRAEWQAHGLQHEPWPELRSRTMESTHMSRGVLLVAGYKLIRGTSALLAAAALAVIVLTGRAAALHTLVEHLGEHWTSALSTRLLRYILSALDGRHVWIVSGALLLDGSFTALEGFALYRGYRWGPWLVVGASALLLPFEAVAWARAPSVGRALLFCANALVAVYLARRARQG